MGIGVPADPVTDSVEANNPVPRSGEDATNKLKNRLTVLERSGNTDLVAQIRWLYDFLGLPYPPP